MEADTVLNRLGVTGYIGGDALHYIYEAHPEYEYTCLVRNSEKGSLVAAQYPKVRLVYGDLDSTDLLTKEASDADIVVSKLFLANDLDLSHISGN